ncbi:pentatricopeptide repeat-containing protein At1g10910, chloroplastic [Silene latifolia]|uniref:pentatricopeptide repeat-containing protein At1g10910, chloroplastic n=1 Tax=Silene latifolia TaxID=37657 RepID=UPI003D789596
MEVTMVNFINGGPLPPNLTMFIPAATWDSKLPSRFRLKPLNSTHISSNTSKKPNKFTSSKPSPNREAALKELHYSSDLTASLSRSEKILRVADLNIVIRSYGRSKRWNDLSQVFEWMRKHGKINIASYSSYIKFMTETRDVSRALNAYEAISDEAMRNNISICNSLLSCLVKNNMFDKAITLFYQMKQNGLQPDVITYSTLLSGCLKVERGYTKALELLSELEDKGITMDSVIYGTLIAVCASNNKCEEAEMYFLRMKAEGHTPNLYHYSSLLNAYSINGSCQKADKLVEDMKSSGLVPNKVVMTTLLKVYVNGGLLDKSRSLLSELEALGYAKDEMPYCQLMDGLSKSGKIVEAEDVFKRMNNRQVRSDGYSHSIMISAFCRAGRLEKAKQLARDYEAKYKKYDLVILNVLLCAYCRAGDMENVMHIMRKMDTLAINPDHKTFQILIKYFIKEKLYLLAYRTLQDMHTKGHQLEEEVLFSLLLQLGRIGAHSEAYFVYNIMRTSGQAIRESLHEKMLHTLVSGCLFEEACGVIKDNARLISPLAIEKFLAAFTQSGNINLIKEVLEAVHISGHRINQDIFHEAISQYIAQPKMKEELLELLQWISKHGYSIDSSTKNLILKHKLIWPPRTSNSS